MQLYASLFFALPSHFNSPLSFSLAWPSQLCHCG
nr:MAG TPA: hypothetical protein [Caudoviricetes sp.]